MLEKVEIWSSSIIECHDLTIHDSVFWEIVQSVEDVPVLAMK